MKTDKAVSEMPIIRINANATMAKFRKKQNEVENQKQRLKTVDVNKYLRVEKFDEDKGMQATGLFQPVSAR